MGAVKVVLGWITGPPRAPIDRRRLTDTLDVLERNARLEGDMGHELREAERVGRGSGGGPFVDLAELVRSTADALRPVATEGNVKVQARCAATSVVVSADARDLTHIVGRLLASAITSSRRDGTVRVQLSLDGDWLRIVVGAYRDAAATRGPSVVTPAEAGHDAASQWEQRGLRSVQELVERYGGPV